MSEIRVSEPLIIADGRKTDGNATGVGHYERSLFSEMEKLSPLLIRKGSGWLFHAKVLIETLRTKGSVYFSPESLLVPAVLGSRSMLTIHDLSPLTHPARHTFRNRLFHKMLLNISVRRVGAILVPTAAVLVDVANLLPSEAARKTHVVHEGVRFEQSSSNTIGDRDKIILYVGTIEPRKNVALLCRAFAHAKSKNSTLIDWRLLIVGKRGWLSPEETHDLEKALSDSGAEELGYRSNEEVQSLLGLAGLFCYVSEAEGFGLPPLEAMAHGTPVIVSDDAALMEVTQDAALIVSRGPELERELAEAIARVVDDEGLRLQMQERGLLRAQAFSWSEAARRTVDVARSITEQHGR